MDGFCEEVLARLPLAEAVMILWKRIADEEKLQAVFDKHRGRCYEKNIAFATVVRLVADAILRYKGSGNQSFSRAKELGDLDASTRAVYGKLGRMPIELSVGLFADMAEQLRELFPAETQRKTFAALRKYSILIIDGKTMKKVAKRLKPLRGVKGGVIGGKAIVASDFFTGLAMAMAADPDGDANDVRLLPRLVSDVRANADRPILFMADAQFCDLVQIGRFSEEENAYLLRFNAKVAFVRDESKAVSEGVDAQGRSYVDEYGKLGSNSNARQSYARRITLSREGEDAIAIVTNLLDAKKYPAAEMLDLYKQRWGIEQMFQKVTEVFSLERLIGGTPEATIFQFAFCLLLYNQTQVIRGYLAKHQAMECERISMEQVFVDVREELTAWLKLVPNETVVEAIPHRSLSHTCRRLDVLLKNKWSNRWIKAVNKKPRAHPKREKSGSHTSAQKARTTAETKT